MAVKLKFRGNMNFENTVVFVTLFKKVTILIFYIISRLCCNRAQKRRLLKLRDV